MEFDNIELRVSAGPTLDKKDLNQVTVNEEQNPFVIDGEHFTGYLCVRILNYKGKIPNPNSNYFDQKQRRYSFMLQGKFAKDVPGDDIEFGVKSLGKWRVPTGIGLAIKVAKWLDPAIKADAHCDGPYLFSPFLCSINSMKVYHKDDKEIIDNVNGKNIGKWNFADKLVPEDCSLLYEHDVNGGDGGDNEKKKGFSFGKKNSTPSKSYQARKKHFNDPKNRKSVTLKSDHIYSLDFYDAYFDLNTLSIKLPGVQLSGVKYWDGQPLIFVARSISNPEKIYFSIWVEFVQRNQDNDDNSCSSDESNYEDCTEGLISIEDDDQHPHHINRHNH